MPNKECLTHEDEGGFRLAERELEGAKFITAQHPLPVTGAKQAFPLEAEAGETARNERICQFSGDLVDYRYTKIRNEPI